MKKKTHILMFLVCIVTAVQAQVYNQIDESGNITRRDENGNNYDNGNFNPNRRDTIQKKEIPRGVRAWTVDRRYGDIRPTELDTMPHLYQNTIFNTGVYGEYNSIGNNYTSRWNRIVIDRLNPSEFIFTDPYDYTIKEPDQFLFVNTLSPYTNISYDNCGNKQNGEDHIDAKFAINANKRLGMGFDLDYHYARGYYQNQNNSNFRASLFATYIGDRYQMHTLFSSYHRKVSENGGITSDNYITHPESFDDQFSEEEIPTVLSQNWNRNNSIHFFLSHRYNIGFYRKVKMTDEEIKARQFAAASAKEKKAKESKDKDKDIDNSLGRKGGKVAGDIPSGRPDNARIAGDLPTDGKKPVEATDSTRIQVDSQQKLDSLLAVQARQDSIDATMKREYVPVTSFIHTLDINNYSRIYQAYKSPEDYYLNTYYNYNDERKYSNDSIYDKTKYLSIKNTFAVALLEGFNKYVKAGLKAFVSYEYRRFQMPDLEEGDDTYFMNKWTGHCLSIGGQLSKTQGKTFHYNLSVESCLTGYDAGALALDGQADLNFPLFGDTVQLAAKAFFHRTIPGFFKKSFHSKHLWWENDLSAETRTHIEGLFSFPKTHTQLRVAIEEIQNYTYFGTSYEMTSDDTNYGRAGLTADVYQESGNINLLTVQLRQDFRLGILNWENIITYQNSSNQNVLPVPAVNIFTNLYLKFKIAKVLSVEIGGDCTFFTKYYAPDYVPQIGQFAIQKNADSRVELGSYPFVDVYANFHLKRARFFVMMSHVNNGSGNKMMFLTPHYPVNGNVLRFGVSWNFYN